jgi:hypothetical protein
VPERPIWFVNAHSISDDHVHHIGQFGRAVFRLDRAKGAHLNGVSPHVDRKPGRLPGTEAAVEVGRTVEPEILQCGRSETRGVALVAHENDMQLVCGKRQTVRAGWVETPLQHGAFDDDGAGESTFIVTIRPGADVHERRSVTLGLESLVRRYADESAARLLHELLDAASARMNHRYPRSSEPFNGQSHPLDQRTCRRWALAPRMTGA